MGIFNEVLKAMPEYAELETAFTAKRLPAVAAGLSSVHKAHFALALSRNLNQKLLLLCDDDAAGVRMCDDINTLWGSDIAAFFPARDYTFREVEGVSREIEQNRISVLSRLMAGTVSIVVAPIDTALTFTIPADILQNSAFSLKEGQFIKTEELAAKLLQLGYARRDFVEGICQFSQRGGIIDIFSPSEEFPIRIEMWGDEIDTISEFEIDSQRRTARKKAVNIEPASEVVCPPDRELMGVLEELKNKAGGSNRDKITAHLDKDLEALRSGLELSSLDRYIPALYDRPETICDYFKDGIVVISEYAQSRERARGMLRQLSEDMGILLEEGILFSALNRFFLDWSLFADSLPGRRAYLFDSFARSIPDLSVKTLVNVEAITTSAWSGEITTLREDLDSSASGVCTVLLAGTEKNAKMLSGDLADAGYKAGFSPRTAPAAPGSVLVMPGMLSSGFEYPSIGFSVISHARAGAASVKKKTQKLSPKERISTLEDVSVGDYVVHISHGIGVFDGIHKLELQGITKDYIKIKYAGADVLYVPVTQLDLVSKYIGPREDSGVRLNRLNSPTWQNTKKRVRKAVDDIAKELLALYAKRVATEGIRFPQDDDWQRDFESRFEYEETEDQLRCADEIKSDMVRPYPMDRLLCGDVGFGKTEVALRAAFKCVMGGYQCAVLVPTTILAWQHFGTIQKRVEGFPVSAELLSRFRTPKQQKETLKKLADGRVDIVVGTHRLIQEDVKFSKLGLVVIDEEQRFGVAHKEKFKKLFHNVDVLTLSATPIPRTLNMAMSGIRDMSVIEQPPMDRFPVQTYVLEYSQPLLTEAIRRELRRGGQVYYLHNRVETIERTAARLASDFPDHTVGVAHGKLSEEELSAVWKRLIDGEIDILVCTSIIETGVDVQNCNTLIVEDADNLGLSQLYQLRGRVGRSTRRAYAYFTFRRSKVISEIAAKRLSAIREFTKFGSGFKIALRDMEIRGAGNVLGSTQHGHMEAVGYDMYLRLLNDAVAELKGEAPPASSVECLLDIRVDAHIPEIYIDNTNARIEVYRRIAAIKNSYDADDVLDELTDRFGDVPDAVKGLVDVALLRGGAARFGIHEINQKGRKLFFSLASLDLDRMTRLAAKMKGRFMLSAGTKPYFTVAIGDTESPLDVIRTVVERLEEVQSERVQ